MTIQIRAATIDDALALSRLAASTFRETFAAENTPEDMARYLAEAFTPEQQAAEITDPASTVLLAEHPGDPPLHLRGGPREVERGGPRRPRGVVHRVGSVDGRHGHSVEQRLHVLEKAAVAAETRRIRRAARCEGEEQDEPCSEPRSHPATLLQDLIGGPSAGGAKPDYGVRRGIATALRPHRGMA